MEGEREREISGSGRYTIISVNVQSSLAKRLEALLQSFIEKVLLKVFVD